MPEKLKELLSSLDRDSAEEVWRWLDGTPCAIDIMIEVVAPIVRGETDGTAKAST